VTTVIVPPPTKTPGPGSSGLIVLCAVNPFDGMKMADRHLAEQLASLAPVLYVDPPVSPLAPLRRRGRAAPRVGLHSRGPGLTQLTPVVAPFPSRRHMTALTTALTRRYLRWAVAQLGGDVLAVIAGWPHFPVFGCCGEKVRVYWAKDDFVGGAALLGLDGGMLARREPRVAASADLVVAASPTVADTWRERGLDTVLIPFGADVAAYRDCERLPAPPDVSLPPPVAGFVGRLNERVDLALLEAVAARGRSLLLVGPIHPGFEPRRVSALLSRPNVSWVGQKPAAALPGYLGAIDVGLVPYGDSPFNRGSFPLKTLEYLAAGRAVVATDLPSVRWLQAQDVRIASNPDQFADEVGRLLAAPRDSSQMRARREFAAQHDWASRAADMHRLILSSSTFITDSS
jgi:teichuronic acid biosynthesis glycosyltransferase TuaH